MRETRGQDILSVWRVWCVRVWVCVVTWLCASVRLMVCSVMYGGVWYVCMRVRGCVVVCVRAMCCAWCMVVCGMCACVVACVVACVRCVM